MKKDYIVAKSSQVQDKNFSMNSSEGALQHSCATQGRRLLANKTPLQWSGKCWLEESPDIDRLDLVSTGHKEMEDGFRVGLHRVNNIS